MAENEAPSPWRFQRWAYSVQTGNAGRKAVLMMLAMMADASTGRCEAKQSTLSKGCEAKERTVREHLRALETGGFIARRSQRRIDGSRRGDEFLLLAPWVTEWPDGEHVANLAGSSQPAESIPGVGSESAGQELPLEERPLSSSVVQPVEAVETQALEPSSHRSVVAGTTREQASNDDEIVFEHWKAATGRNGATRLTPERRAKIRARRQTFSIAELCRSVDLAVADPFIMGDNDRGQRYDDLTSLFLNDDRVAKRLENADLPKAKGKKDAFREGLLAIARGEA